MMCNFLFIYLYLIKIRFIPKTVDINKPKQQQAQNGGCC